MGLTKLLLKFDFAKSLRNKENFFPYISVPDNTLIEEILPVVRDEGWEVRKNIAENVKAGINFEFIARHIESSESSHILSF